MTDSDEDSFHSASEGEDLELGDSSKPVIVPKKESPPPPIVPKAVPTSIVKETVALDKTVESVYDDANQSAEWDKHPLGQQVDHFDSEVSKDSEKSTPEDGWEDFGDEADTEGDSDVEKIESDEGEYYHRQLLDKKLMPPPPLPSKDDDPKEHKNSGGLFDWSAIHNVVSAVGEGLSSVVETGLGLPAPEEAARLSVAQRRKLLEDAQQIKEPEPSLSSDEGGVSPEGSIHGLQIHHQRPQHKASAGGFSGFLGGFGSIVNGSLDVLETLGKKTYETLTVKDESEKRRFILQPGKETNLSDILRELKESEDAPPNSPKMMGCGNAIVKNTGVSFLHEFEDNDGLVHLECFELLSKDYFAKKVADKQFSKFDEKMGGFCLEDVSECNTEDFAKGIKKQIAKFNVGYRPTPLIDANNDLTEKLKDVQSRVDKGADISVDEFHRLAVVALAKLTSKAIESLCRLVQQMLVSQQKPDLESLFTFTYLICRRLSFFASQYANLLSLLEQTSKVEEAVTNIFFECSNACLYLKKALELARPFFTDDGFIFNPNAKSDVKPEDFLKSTSVRKKSSQNTEDEWENW